MPGAPNNLDLQNNVMNDFKSKIMSRFSQYKVPMKNGQTGVQPNIDKIVKKFTQRMSNIRSKMLFQASKVRRVSMIQFGRKKTHGTNYSAEKIKRRSTDKQGLVSLGNSIKELAKLKGPSSKVKIYSTDKLSSSISEANLFEESMTSPDIDGIMESIGDVSQEERGIGNINRVGDLKNKFFGGKDVVHYSSSKRILPLNQTMD